MCCVCVRARARLPRISHEGWTLREHVVVSHPVVKEAFDLLPLFYVSRVSPWQSEGICEQQYNVSCWGARGLAVALCWSTASHPTFGSTPRSGTVSCPSLCTGVCVCVHGHMLQVLERWPLESALSPHLTVSFPTLFSAHHNLCPLHVTTSFVSLSCHVTTIARPGCLPSRHKRSHVLLGCHRMAPSSTCSHSCVWTKMPTVLSPVTAVLMSRHKNGFSPSTSRFNDVRPVTCMAGSSRDMLTPTSSCLLIPLSARVLFTTACTWQ